MPAYPCGNCGTQVDHRDLTCRSCGDKKPFRCSKCEKPLNAMDIYNAEQLTFQKPLFCPACGREAEPIPCPSCKRDVYRTLGMEDDGVFYHPDCYKTVQMQKKVTPIMRGVLAVALGIAAFSGFSQYAGSQVVGAMASVGGIALGYALGGLMAPRR